MLPSTATVHAERPAAKHVLVLYWYSKQNPTNVQIERGFLEGLRFADTHVEYYSEFLENERFRDSSQDEILHEFLRRKYARQQIDVVVASGLAAHSFLERHLTTLFPNTPRVYIGQRPRPNGPNVPKTTGISPYRDFRKRLDLIKRLQPDARTVVVISGTLEHDKGVELTARNELKGYDSSIAVTYLTDLPLDSLVAAVRSLPPRSAILFTWQQLRDADGRLLEPADVLTAIAPVTVAPIYGMSGARLGSGIIGGELFTIEDVGRRAAQMVIRILDGTPAELIPAEGPATAPMFDWRELRRWNIPADRLPPNSDIEFRELTVWDRDKWYILGSIAICLVQGALIIALLIQRASRQRAELRAQTQQHQLTHLGRVATVGELTGALAHEIRQPLTAILTNARAAQQLLEDSTVNREELRHVLDEIANEDLRAADVISRIRILLRKNDVDHSDVDLNVVIEDTLALLRSELRKRGVTLTFTPADTLPSVLGDRVELQQVVLNLVLNACDAMSTLPVSRRALVIRTFATADGVQASVSDRGAGLPAGGDELIFNPFFTTKPEGLGLGLAICRGIIAAHEGGIWAERNVSGGATFWLRLPTKTARTKRYSPPFTLPEPLSTVQR